MRILFKKTGNFAFDPINGPVMYCEANKVEDIPDNQAKILMRDGWAEEFIPPWLAKGWNRDAPEAKDILFDYCMGRYGEPIDRRRAISTLIRDIKRIAKRHG